MDASTPFRTPKGRSARPPSLLFSPTAVKSLEGKITTRTNEHRKTTWLDPNQSDAEVLGDPDSAQAAMRREPCHG